MSATFTIKDLFAIVKCTAICVSILFLAALMDTPMPSPSAGLSATLSDALHQFATIAPFFVIAAVLILPRAAEVERAFGRVPPIRMCAAAAWLIVAGIVSEASKQAHAGHFVPSLLILVQAFSVGGLGFALLVAEAQQHRDSAA